MKAFTLSVLGMLLCVLVLGQGKARIMLTVDGFTGKQVDIDFAWHPEYNQQFVYVAKQPIELEVELDGLTMMSINRWNLVCLRPGDDIRIKLEYQSRYDETMEFTGTPDAVLINQTMQKMRHLRLANGYKINMMSAVVTMVPIEQYYRATLAEWKAELAVLDSIKRDISQETYLYIKSEHEGMLLDNLINYPFAEASFLGLLPEEVLPDDYWNVLANYQLREDKASLRSRSYMGFLLSYKQYMRHREAGMKGGNYVVPTDIRVQYDDLVAFYSGELRESALVVFLCGVISQGTHQEQAEPLIKDFLRKYCRDKGYRKTLEGMLK